MSKRTAKTQDEHPEVERLRPGLLTITEAAAFLRCSVRWLYDAVKLPADVEGSVPAYKMPFGGNNIHWRFDPEELRAWAAADFPAVADFREQKATRGA